VSDTQPLGQPPRNDPRVLLGLLGHPIAHSAAPAMHEAAGDALGLRVLYRLLEIPGLDAAGLRRVLHGARELGFAGLNVTFPYKEAVLPLLDGLSANARAVAAVNTVVVTDGQLIGHNTDASGFAAALRDELGTPIAGPENVTRSFRAVSKWRWLLLHRGMTADQSVPPPAAAASAA